MFKPMIQQRKYEERSIHALAEPIVESHDMPINNGEFVTSNNCWLLKTCNQPKCCVQYYGSTRNSTEHLCFIIQDEFYRLK